ncbi:MAG: hypothetical protein R6V13_08245 [Anaerolineae bacterium]
MAVENSLAQRTLRQAEVVHTPDSKDLRTAGNKTLLVENGQWTDTEYKGTMDVKDVTFASPGYFEVAREHPDWGPYLTLDERVLFEGAYWGAKGNPFSGGKTMDMSRLGTKGTRRYPPARSYIMGEKTDE